jgi:phytoene dehydrogenase-like protein
MDDMDVIVVGAGHNGLVAASYLARAGLRVVMFERLPHVGGAAVTEELWPGFRFSTCAHTIHAIHPRIIRDLRLRERGFAVLSRGPWRRFQPNGTYFGTSYDASPRNLAYADRLTPEEREGIRQLRPSSASRRTRTCSTDRSGRLSTYWCSFFAR